MAEVIHGDYAALVRDGGPDGVTQYELWKAIWSSLNDGNFFELAWALDQHNGFLAEFLPLTFVGNHDVTRLASKLTDPRHLAHAVLVLSRSAGCRASSPATNWRSKERSMNGRMGMREIRQAFPARPGELATDGWPVYRFART